MTAPTDYTVPVLVHVPRPIYRMLAATARRHDVSVGALVVEVVRRALEVRSVRRGRDFWTVADDEVLRALHAAGLSGPQIAERMERSNTTIMRHRDRLGLTPHFSGRPRKASS